MTPIRRTAGQMPPRIARQRRLVAALGAAAAFATPVALMIYGPAAILVGGLVIAACVLHHRRIRRTWVPGMEAERRVGALIERALDPRGGALAHDVTGLPGLRGNIDHLALTAEALWVIDTKAGRLPRRRLRGALRACARQAACVHAHLRRSGIDDPRPVRPLLVLAHPARRRYRRDFTVDVGLRRVTACGTRLLGRLLAPRRGAPAPDPDPLADAVRALGQDRHPRQRA